MKFLSNNPILIYIIIPVLAGLWPLLLFLTYLPNAQENKDDQIDKYNEASLKIAEIISLSPERLEKADVNDAEQEFTFNTAVYQIANQCKIPSSQYTLSPWPTSEKNTQRAKVDLDQVSIETFAQFLTQIQFRWPKLQCTQVTLDNEKDLKDIWDIDIDFLYHY